METIQTLIIIYMRERKCFTFVISYSDVDDISLSSLLYGSRLATLCCKRALNLEKVTLLLHILAMIMMIVVIVIVAI